ncbi:uncharacterized protein Dvar_40490 [Desulfosarcina variabilis str. Montpellier]|uniref:hypothetical protein n=1 Tax=Desulfosarcina variabilis TaxID=2300 RepID=UPI003AFAFA7B
MDYWRSHPLYDRSIAPLLGRGCQGEDFTARANDPRQHPLIQDWLRQVGLPEDLEITATKDYAMIQSYDDRMVQVERNTGRIITDN